MLGTISQCTSLSLHHKKYPKEKPTKLKYWSDLSKRNVRSLIKDMTIKAVQFLDAGRWSMPSTRSHLALN